MKNLSLLAVALTLSVVIQAQEASRWRGPSGDGKYPDTGLLKQWPENGPAVVWKFDQLGTGFSSPAEGCFLESREFHHLHHSIR